MQIAVILAGCLLGFIAGLTALVVLGLGVVASVSIWAASGPLSVLLLVALSAIRQPIAKTATAPARAEIA